MRVTRWSRVLGLHLCGGEDVAQVVQTDDTMLFAPDGSGRRYSLAQYYREVSGGVFTVAGTVLPWMTLARPRAYYGRQHNPFIRDVLAKADSTVDWRQYDNDGPDGVAQNEDDEDSSYNETGADYFRTLGLPLISGREFTPQDIAATPKVAVVNEAFAKHFFGGQNPIGRRFDRGKSGTPKYEIEIVGLVKNAKYSSIQEAPPRVFYIASVQYVRQDSQSFYVRTGLDPKLISNSIRATISSLDPNLPVRDLKTMQTQVDENLFAERLMALLTAGFAGLATLLAAIGLYGVLSFNIARRTREIGIRMALGATQGNVRKLVVREAGIMLGIGTIAGIGAAVGLGRFVDSLLFGMKPWDPYVYLSATVLLALVALLAAYVPVRRATKVSPMVALRYE